jgi:hypothetical protein
MRRSQRRISPRAMTAINFMLRCTSTLRATIATYRHLSHRQLFPVTEFIGKALK